MEIRHWAGSGPKRIPTRYYRLSSLHSLGPVLHAMHSAIASSPQSPRRCVSNSLCHQVRRRCNFKANSYEVNRIRNTARRL
ncbi:hypothetical protein EV356DRAFT_234184 [Viridothelium virens]|uniref:Uncharacterized protein n=1 Tax=Viridothelium virens TaxID=1048519 RepID=A0A6A6H508_VIRVR|nr:hypothetical protein EV356DRAFT_234184 [Viridothelium virens]